VPAAGGVREIDRDLRVLDPARGAGVLALHPDGVFAHLQIAGLVHDQHRVRFAQVIGDEPAQIRGHAVGIPDRPVKQVLHRVRAGQPGVLGDAPTGLARQFRKHPAHKPGEMLPGLHSREPAGNPVEELTFQRRPQAGLYAVARGHRVIF
jgi:hypothetical protein